MPSRDIDATLRTHDAELLAIPGVVGVYVGLADDGKTPCLRVMVVKKTPDLEQRIPKSLEGLPVVVEETGVIRPLRSDGSSGGIRNRSVAGILSAPFVLNPR